MVSFGIGLGSFVQGMGQGMQLGNQIKGAIDDAKIRKIERAGSQEATAAREKDILGAIRTNSDAQGQPSYSVGDQTVSSMEDARKLAEKQVGGVMDYYRTTTIPKLIQGYIDIGKPEQAERLQTWMDGQESNAITKDWASAARLAMIGDQNGAMKGFGKLYERLQPGAKYLGTEDITEPTYEEHTLPKTGEKIRVETGSRPVGVRLKLRGPDGADVSHDFTSSEDLFNTAMFTLSPDKFALRALDEVQAARIARAAAAKEDWQFGRDLQKERFKAVLDDQRDERQFRRGVMRDDRQFAQQSQRDEIQHGYRMDETATELQMRAALKLAEDSGQKVDDVRRSIETISKRMAETSNAFDKLTPEQQTAAAVQEYQRQQGAAKSVLGRGATSGTPSLY